MRRLFSILLLVVYTTLICGFTLNLHYCGGKLDSVALSLSEKHSCSCGSKTMKKNCCKNKTIHCKFNAEQKSQHFTLIYNSAIKYNLCTFSLFQNMFNSDFYLSNKIESSHSPPFLVSSNPSYIVNRVFRV